MVITAVSPTERARVLLDDVVDPDIPFLTIADIAILRGVTVDDAGTVTVTITPTYSGCPALESIRSDIIDVLTTGGFDAVTIIVAHSPAWTTEWMSDVAKQKLAANRIAPPGSVLDIVPEILCPMCNANEIRTISEFGSTACKSIMVCTQCGEPFDYFKAI